MYAKSDVFSAYLEFESWLKTQHGTSVKRLRSNYQVLAVEQVSVDAKEGGNDCCIYLAVEQVYYT